MMMRTVTVAGFLSLLFSCLLGVNDLSAQARVGFVEPRAILERMPEMRAVQQRLQNFAERKSNELAEMEGRLQQEIETYQQKIGVISEAARQKEEERLGQLDLELRQSQAQAQQELQQRRAELMAPLLEQIQNSIDAVAQERGLDYVLNTSTQMGDVIILYVKEEMREQYDITDAVMRHLGI